jgi:predicted acylesterase/phospholipase RssA
MEELDIESTESVLNDKKIQHIVMSGGGIVGLSFYGVLRESNKRGKWDINNIKTIYGTSVGSIFAVFLALRYEWEVLDDYIIKRPWQNVFNFSIQNILSIFHTRGIFDVKLMEEIFSPLFKGRDISIDVTMKEFYEITGIELHFFSVNINNFAPIDFSYKTHPDWRVVDAVYSSSGLPILFQPIIKDDVCYTDGGMVSNYPVKNCIENGADPETIFGLCRKPIVKLNFNITNDSSLFDYILNIFYKTIEKVLNKQDHEEIGHEIYIDCPPLSINDILNSSSKMEERIRIIQFGVDSCISHFYTDQQNDAIVDASTNLLITHSS